jgi:hypothetical protein
VLVFFQVTFKLGRVRRVGGWHDRILVRRKNRALRWDCLHAYLFGRQAPTDPSISRLLTSTETGGESFKYFLQRWENYGQSEGDPVDLTGGEKAILPAWILRNAKGDLHGLFRARSEVYSVDSPRLFVPSWVPIRLARGQEREFQCPDGG